MPGWWFVFYPQLIWKMPPQLWRFGTAFLLTGPSLSLLFDTYFLYSYLSQLEVGNPRFPRKEDLVWYLMFVGGTIMVSSCLCSAHVFAFATLVHLPIFAVSTTPHLSARIVNCLHSYHGS